MDMLEEVADECVDDKACDKLLDVLECRASKPHFMPRMMGKPGFGISLVSAGAGKAGKGAAGRGGLDTSVGSAAGKASLPSASFAVESSEDEDFDFVPDEQPQGKVAPPPSARVAVAAADPPPAPAAVEPAASVAAPAVAPAAPAADQVEKTDETQDGDGDEDEGEYEDEEEDQAPGPAEEASAAPAGPASAPVGGEDQAPAPMAVDGSVALVVADAAPVPAPAADLAVAPAPAADLVVAPAPAAADLAVAPAVAADLAVAPAPAAPAEGGLLSEVLEDARRESGRKRKISEEAYDVASRAARARLAVEMAECRRKEAETVSQLLGTLVQVRTAQGLTDEDRALAAERVRSLLRND